MQYYIYILGNNSNSLLYIGVTKNILKRIYEHKNKALDSFSSKYNLDILLYYEVYEDIEEAIKREKQLKGWTKVKKEKLILLMNPEKEDLYNSICQ